MPSPVSSRANSRILPFLEHSRTFGVFVLVLLATILAGACVTGSTSRAERGASAAQRVDADPNSVQSITAGFGDDVRRDVEVLRSATAAFLDVSTAQAAGYPTTLPKCIADSTMGGMGRHYFDRSKYDGTLDVAHPEMLIYAPDGAGKPDKLVAVEYVVPFAILPSTEKPPRLFGQELHRNEDFKYWNLHVWAWKQNKAGLFAEWDPSIKC